MAEARLVGDDGAEVGKASGGLSPAGTAGVVCCTVREFALANPVGTG